MSESIQLPMFDAIEIPLTMGYTAFIDTVDADLMASKWYARVSEKYWVYPARSVGKNKKECLHRIIAERVIGRHLAPLETVDHINGNTLDNRRANIRVCTQAGNTYNRGLNRNNTSGYKGVLWDNQRGKWRAVLYINHKSHYVGCFTDTVEAARAYDTAAIAHYGEFARTNVMLGLLPPLDTVEDKD